MNNSSSNNASLVDLTELKNISNGDVAFYLDMIKLFINTTKDGLSDIEEASPNNDWQTVANSAHKISAPCQHLSATSLYIYLKEIENTCRTEKDTKNVHTLIENAKNEFYKIKPILEDELNSVSKNNNLSL
jgi:HPt (histidine-containing phosphotransfer) domain-containing protein